MQFSEPRVLVVSHNVFSASGNMGKTMMHMLAGISPDNLAQLYFHQEIPTRSCCLRYFRITDSNVLHALFTRRAEYRVFEAADIDESASQSRTDTGSLAKIYQFSRRRTPLIYFLRDLMWRLGKWNTPALLEWVQSFSPDVIFFAAGDYAFPYRIALRLSALLHIPIVMWCADDFYIEQVMTNYFTNAIKHAKEVNGEKQIKITIQNVNDKIKFLNEVANILSKIENNMEREVYIDKISLEYKVSKEAIYAEVNKKLYGNSQTEKKLERPVTTIREVKQDVAEKEVDEKTKKTESLIAFLTFLL